MGCEGRQEEGEDRRDQKVELKGGNGVNVHCISSTHRQPRDTYTHVSQSSFFIHLHVHLEHTVYSILLPSKVTHCREHLVQSFIHTHTGRPSWGSSLATSARCVMTSPPVPPLAPPTTRGGLQTLHKLQRQRNRPRPLGRTCQRW